MTQRLAGKRVVVTSVDNFMGMPTVDKFREEGAEVIYDDGDLTEPGACEALIERAGHVDVLIANLAAPTFSGIPVTELDDDDFATCFEIMVYPLHRLTRAVLPQMLERKEGKIVVYGSSSPLRGMRTLAGYSSARGAQIGYVRSVGVEVAPNNVQVNLIAQNYVQSPDYYPPELMAKESFRKSLARQVPLGRLASPEEDAAFAAFLASDEADFFVGQAIPFSGGWVQ